MPLSHTVHEVSLRNGAKGLIIDVPGTSVVSYEIEFRAGNEYVTKKERQQTAHIMEHLAFGANRLHATSEEFSQEFGKNGAYFNATTYDRDMVYHADSPLMEWQRILDLLKLVIAEPKYSNESL